MIVPWRELLTTTADHLGLVIAAALLTTAIAVPAGVAITRRPSLSRPVLGIANVLQTVPSLALFGLLLPLPYIGGIGARTAIVALVVYGLLPVLRATVTGIEGVDASVREAAVAMGMTARQRLLLVELPLALPVIASGVRVATVTAVGVATIAAAIGAGGLGTYIFRGLRMNDDRLLLAGAVPAAIMAVVLDLSLGLVASRLGARTAAGAPRRKEGRRLAVRLAGAALAFMLAGALLLWWVRQSPSAAPQAGERFARSGSSAAATASTHSREGTEAIVIGSKDYTEQLVLGELLAQAAEARGQRVVRRFELGGNLCHEALVAGNIDGYVEYTGTAWTALLHHPPVTDEKQVLEGVRKEYRERFGLEVGPPLGFSNDFAILVRGDVARQKNLHRISDVAPLAATWRAGFGQDFLSRPDGYSGFVSAYGLRFAGAPREMDLSLTYRALAAGEVDLIAGNSTDGLIAALDLAALDDDRHYFPPYEAVPVFRRAALDRFPEMRAVLADLAEAISTEEMRRMNLLVDGEHQAPAEVARRWLERRSPHKRAAESSPTPN